MKSFQAGQVRAVMTMSSVDPSHATSARSVAMDAPERSGTYAPHRRAGADRPSILRSRRAPTRPGPTTQAATSGPSRRGRLLEAPKGLCHLPVNAGPTNVADGLGVRPPWLSYRGQMPKNQKPQSLKSGSEDRSHLGVVVVERLVVVAALVDAAPSEVRRRWQRRPPRGQRGDSDVSTLAEAQVRGLSSIAIISL